MMSDITSSIVVALQACSAMNHCFLKICFTVISLVALTSTLRSCPRYMTLKTLSCDNNNNNNNNNNSISNSKSNSNSYSNSIIVIIIIIIIIIMFIWLSNQIKWPVSYHICVMLFIIFVNRYISYL